jgi:hypothetical protein
MEIGHARAFVAKFVEQAGGSLESIVLSPFPFPLSPFPFPRSPSSGASSWSSARSTCPTFTSSQRLPTSATRRRP